MKAALLRLFIMPYLPLFLALFAMTSLSAYESAFARTPVDTVEIKQLPPCKVIIARAESPYFAQVDSLFRPLFQYIKANNIAMTVPVEAEINPGAMLFYLGSEAAERELPNSNNVSVEELPARTVASIGNAGVTREANFLKARTKLEAWLARATGIRPARPARIYWNGPLPCPL
jgi:DNA gyrase inhibitor GyrI